MLRNYKLLSLEELAEERKKQLAVYQTLTAEVKAIELNQASLKNELARYQKYSTKQIQTMFNWRKPIFNVVKAITDSRLLTIIAGSLGIVGVAMLFIGIILALSNPIGFAAAGSTLMLLAGANVLMGGFLFLLLKKQIRRVTDYLSRGLINEYYDLHKTLTCRASVVNKQDLINKRDYYRSQLGFLDREVERKRTAAITPLNALTLDDQHRVVPRNIAHDVEEFEKDVIERFSLSSFKKS